ncbi:hypothetical protein ACFLUT_00545 [Chloroflexota bacterium]
MRSKSVFAIVVALVLLLSLTGTALADKPDEGTKGNGLPKDAGKSYNFNVIGVPDKDEAWGKSGGNGSRIFVDRTGTTKVYVWGGDDFAIQDRDGTDGFVGTDGHSEATAGIVLPYAEGKWECTVYVRLLGPVDASLRWKSEYYDGSNWLPLDTFTLSRNSKFAIPNGKILADGVQDICWTWDLKNNFRIMQFRIFVGAPEGGYPPPE